MSQYFLIILDRPNPAEIKAVQTMATAHADEWWHEIDNVWAVKGHTAAYWRDLVGAILTLHKEAGVLVLPLPEGKPLLAFRGPHYLKRMRWLRKVFSFREESSEAANRLVEAMVRNQLTERAANTKQRTED